MINYLFTLISRTTNELISECCTMWCTVLMESKYLGILKIQYDIFRFIMSNVGEWNGIFFPGVNPRFTLEATLLSRISLPSPRCFQKKLWEEFDLVANFWISHVLRITNASFLDERLLSWSYSPIDCCTFWDLVAWRCPTCDKMNYNSYTMRIT